MTDADRTDFLLAALASASDGLLEAPAYTRPATWRGLSVPDVLRGGDHAAITAWRREQSLARTRDRRPDLLGDEPFTAGGPRG